MLERHADETERYSSFNKCKKKDLANAKKDVVCLASLEKDL